MFHYYSIKMKLFKVCVVFWSALHLCCNFWLNFSYLACENIFNVITVLHRKYVRWKEGILIDQDHGHDTCFILVCSLLIT